MKKAFISYKMSNVGRGVLTYENGKFTHLLTVGNDPKNTMTEQISESQGLAILRMIAEENYQLETCLLIEKEVKKVEEEEVKEAKEVVLA